MKIHIGWVPTSAEENNGEEREQMQNLMVVLLCKRNILEPATHEFFFLLTRHFWGLN